MVCLMSEDFAPPPSSEELAANMEKWVDHQNRGHELTVHHKMEWAYVFFCAECSCGEKFVVNCIER